LSYPLHNADITDICAGPGEVSALFVPYCIPCGDVEPPERGCIHTVMYGSDAGIIKSVNMPNLAARR